MKLVFFMIFLLLLIPGGYFIYLWGDEWVDEMDSYDRGAVASGEVIKSEKVPGGIWKTHRNYVRFVTSNNDTVDASFKGDEYKPGKIELLYDPMFPTFVEPYKEDSFYSVNHWNFGIGIAMLAIAMIVYFKGVQLLSKFTAKPENQQDGKYDNRSNY